MPPILPIEAESSIMQMCRSRRREGLAQYREVRILISAGEKSRVDAPLEERIESQRSQPPDRISGIRVACPIFCQQIRTKTQVMLAPGLRQIIGQLIVRDVWAYGPEIVQSAQVWESRPAVTPGQYCRKRG